MLNRALNVDAFFLLHQPSQTSAKNADMLTCSQQEPQDWELCCLTNWRNI